MLLNPSRALSRRSNLIVQIAPGRIHSPDQICLPRARPVLDVFLTLDRRRRRIVDVEINKLINLVPLRVSRHELLFVFIHTPPEIARNSDVKGAARTAG